MHPKRTTMVRTLLVPVLVLVLGVGAIISIISLQAHARSSAEAQLQLAHVENAVNALQIAPFRAMPMLGGTPASARASMDAGKLDIDTTLAELRADEGPAELRLISAPLHRDYALLEQIYTASVTGDFGAASTKQTARALAHAQHIAAQLHVAAGVYKQRAQTADARATGGSAAVILLLVSGFALLYRRSVKARTIAERLVMENKRLLAASRIEAHVDSMTGLPNRRSLGHDLEVAFAGHDGREHELTILDLDGFKQYNDTFGHPAGDALLTRLGARLTAAVSGRGTAYRMGGDEFCVLGLVGADGGRELVELAADALSEVGEAFDIGCSHGTARLGHDAVCAEDALRLADQRMYAQKAGRASSGRQSSDVLLNVLRERSPNLHDHLSNVAELAEAVGRRAGLAELDVQWLRIAAELHDVGKVAIPDAILNKPGPLNDDEWAFMRRHTVIGERIIRSAPSLAPAAALVRSSHERYDGGGYPDGLSATEIDTGAGIIAICDAYDAMTNSRVYRSAMAPQDALAELRRCAGTQFEPALVDVFCETMKLRDAARADTGSAVIV